MTADTAITDRVPAAVEHPTPQQAGRTRFFDDIAGLRGVAVLLVVLFHAHVPGVPGGFIGVDVFFVISGFLITRLLLREYEKSGTISFRGFYARRARRIIPAAALVIVVSIIGAALTMPLLKVFKQALDLLAAAAQVANWHFIAQNADYLAGAIDGSLATHFWSLSIEEQLYLVWPLTVFLAIIAVARTPLGRYLPARVAVGIVVGAISAASLIAAIRLTPTDPALAYMATYTRAWQFGAGALIAIAEPLLTRAPFRSSSSPRGASRASVSRPLFARLTPRWSSRLPSRWSSSPRGASRASVSRPLPGTIAAILIGWLALATLLLAANEITPHTPYPGTAALYPTAAAAALIIAGQLTGTPLPTASWLLAIPPLRFLGRVSYAWYLWHWPAIVLCQTITGTTSWPLLLAVSLGALVIATLSTMFFEEPIIANAELRRNASASISVGLTGIVVSLVVTMSAGIVTVKLASEDTVASASLTYQSVFGVENTATSGAVVPNPFQAYDDRPSPNECLVPVGQRSPTRSCVFGPDDGIPVVLFGDSHAEQWAEAIRSIGADHWWRIHQFTKAACPAQNLPPQPHALDPFTKQDCRDWRADSLAQIAAVHPRIIIVSSLSTYVPKRDVVDKAWTDTMTSLRATGARIVYIADTPYPNFQVADCMSGALDQWSKCDFALDDVPRIEPLLNQQSGRGAGRIVTVSVNDLLCSGRTCFPARNKILLYRDESHLTATAAKVLEPALVTQLDRARFDYGTR